jgi:starch synthase (maltosyl-transferring)
VQDHPEWFAQRPDGSIAYAENPPKKYQDIYPLDFDRDPEGLFAEIRRIIELWIREGVSIFRVDNPHTKPLDFWERMLADVRAAHPDVVFLAEAFTRPAMLKSLAGAGFQQSYTYFTWRNTKTELEEFLTSISQETAAFLRPNLWVNTPDILTEYLQHGGRAAYKVRAVLAATGSPSWGVYSGYELMESEARPGSEENLDNEKYEYKQRDWSSPSSLAPYLTMLNDMRAAHPSLRQLRDLTIHWSEDEAILVYAKHLDGAFTESGLPDTTIVVVNLDPIAARETTIHLDLTAFGLPEDARFDVVDRVTGARWKWGRDQYVRLDPAVEPAHVLAIDPGTVTA